MGENKLLTAALSYAGCGLAVLPLRAGGKAPDGRLVPHGLTQASTDPALLRRWWAAAPDANVGIRTGGALDVLDIDGPEAVGVLVARGLLEVGGVVVSTGRGWHVYFAGGALPTRAGVLPGIDVRGRGGYVVAPPSVHPSGSRYAFLDTASGELAEALADSLALVAPPEWLVELCAPRPVTEPAERTITREVTTRYAWAALEDECAQVATTPPGGRNHRLNTAAFSLGTLVGAGALEAAVVELALAEAAMIAGLPAGEARLTIRSGLGAGMARPRRITRPVAR
ncbi:MAG TPA: bifunctional DNA primase/polymerase [Acidimicrobiales bacterium]|nr:bifunctional DNA primase/polymerase [Acidimicrobiales bacterium]